MSTTPHSDTPAEPGFMQRLIDRMQVAPFFTVSLLLHIIILVLVGGTVMYKVTEEAQDFQAGNEGLMSDMSDAGPPPETPQDPTETFTPQVAAVTAPAVTALSTTSTAATSFSVNALPMQDNQLKGLGDNAAAMANLSKKVGESASMGAAGKAGGTMKSGMIFGKKVEATKLGVILDVSGSGHPHLAEAIKEIEKTFKDSIIILYPGCGMIDWKGKRPHEIRRMDAITKKDLPEDVEHFSTPGQLVKALKIDEFERLTKRPAMRERLFVSWYLPDANTKGGQLINHTNVAFEDLEKKGVDTIYWFADFKDKVNMEVSQDLLKELKRKKIRVYLNNFAGDPIPPESLLLAEGTGGTATSEKLKK
jgi:hypothetical protein